MADIKTRDAVKGTIKALDKSAIAGERMKSAYAKTKDKAEQGYYAEENSPTEYASDKVSHASGRIKDEGIHQFNKQGQKNVQITKENIGNAKDKIAEFKTKRAVKAAEQKKAQAVAEKNGSLIRNGAASRSSVPDVPKQGEMPQTQTGASQLIKTRRQGSPLWGYHDAIRQGQGKKTIKTTARNAERTVKTTAKGTVKATEKGVKTAGATSKAAIKTTEQTAKAAQKTAKASAKAAQKTAQTAKATAKATAEATKATVRATIAAVKAIIAGTKALISAIIAGGWVAIVIILIVVLLGCAVSLFGGGSESTSYTPVSAEVEAYTPLIQKYAKQYGIPEYVELIKAVMMQESGGKGNDPMQAAEGSFNKKYPHEPNGIKDPEYSIECGVQELKAALTSAEVESPIDMEHIKLALQGYNFGNGYISWAKTNYGGYSYANAVEFSAMQAQRLGWEKYGDTQYPAHVLRYYPYGRAFTSGGNQAIVEVALTQLGNEGGQPYWSWYGFDGRVEWCACFVSWCSEQCGYLESGIIPKFSLCSDGVNWFKGKGQWQDKNYEPQAGDIIFFDWGNDGSIDHVGIVEKCENGTVYIVEGNSGDACRQQSYPVGSSSIYGYGCPNY
ncbi:CHAP domain-containing protein [Clostridiaceae bacterium]|nr:CHAP domain-containing protein [Clostridiaceae bacterium]